MPTSPQGYTYQKLPNAEYKRFSEDYFSGQDMRIYFGNTWVDEIVGMQFQMVENVAPIFGYASYTYDTVAVGSRQIQGSFRINFKESYYLHSITNRLDYEMSDRKQATSNNIDVPGMEMAANRYVSIDHLMGSIESIYTPQEFDKLALQFEKSLWGQSGETGSSLVNTPMQSNTNNRGDDSYFAPAASRPNIAKDGFSILVLYGPYTQAYNAQSPNEKVASTAHTLTGVHLTGVSQISDNTGQPIFEEYTFIAKDLDGNVNLLNPNPTYKFGQVTK